MSRRCRYRCQRGAGARTGARADCRRAPCVRVRMRCFPLRLSSHVSIFDTNARTSAECLTTWRVVVLVVQREPGGIAFFGLERCFDAAVAYVRSRLPICDAAGGLFSCATRRRQAILSLVIALRPSSLVYSVRTSPFLEHMSVGK